MGSIEQNKEIVHGYVQAILVERDFSKFQYYTAPGFYIDRSAVPEAIKGEQGLHTQMDMLYSAFPDLTLTIVDMVAEGDKVVVRFEGPGTLTAPSPGFRRQASGPSGKAWSCTILSAIRSLRRGPTGTTGA